MPRHVQGRRVESVEDIERSGDYAVKFAVDGRVEALWFAMPGFSELMWNRIPGPAAIEANQRWDITVDGDGPATVSPSILSEWTWGEGREHRRFHGYLKAGVWEVLDDTVGAQFD